MANKIVQSSNTRVFIIEGRASPAHAPTYHSCMRMLGISQDFGTVESLECPDPYKYGAFIEVAQIRGAASRPTTSLQGRYAMDVLSVLLKLARIGCSYDVQLHMGKCTDPSQFNTFEKAIIMEGATISTYSTDDLGALASGDNAAVNEQADVTGESVYEVRPMTFSQVADAVITNAIVDVLISDTLSCGDDCDDASTGCEKIYALSSAAGGSPGTPADVIFSPDKSVTWYAHDIDTLGAAEEPVGIESVGDYIVVISTTPAQYHYVPKSEMTGLVDPVWTEVAFTAQAPVGIYSIGYMAFIVGTGGYVWTMTDPTAGVTVVSAGAATTQTLYDVHALDTEYAVAVGDAGAVIYATTRTNWTAAAVPVNASLTAVWMLSKTEWLVGTDTGRLFYTSNTGASWAEKSFPGSGTGNVDDIKFATRSIGYLAHTTGTPAGRILRTYDGGYSWVVMPEGTGTMVANTGFNALAVCKYDPNVLVAGGDVTGGDGILLYATAS